MEYNLKEAERDCEAHKVFNDIHRLGNFDDVVSAYDSIAECFEELSQMHGYTGHSYTTSKVSEIEPNRDARILDVGCGTGQVGDEMFKAGYRNVHGVDVSGEFIRIAQKKETYVHLVTAKFGPSKPLKFTNGYFDVVLSSGCFLPNHLNETAIPEMMRLVKSGGHIVITTRKKTFEDEEGDMKLKSGLRDLVNDGLLKKVSHDEFVYAKNANVMGVTMTYSVI